MIKVFKYKRGFINNNQRRTINTNLFDFNLKKYLNKILEVRTMKLNRGQGSLEYLIIIAAVLAIAAIVVLFLTGAFKQTGAGVSACKQAASRCNTEQATSTGAVCDYCVSACNDPTAAMNATGYTADTEGGVVVNTSAYKACIAGDPEAIYSTAQ